MLRRFHHRCLQPEVDNPPTLALDQRNSRQSHSLKASATRRLGFLHPQAYVTVDVGGVVTGVSFLQDKVPGTGGNTGLAPVVFPYVVFGRDSTESGALYFL